MLEQLRLLGKHEEYRYKGVTEPRRPARGAGSRSSVKCRFLFPYTYAV